MYVQETKELIRVCRGTKEFIHVCADDKLN